MTTNCKNNNYFHRVFVSSSFCILLAGMIGPLMSQTTIAQVRTDQVIDVAPVWAGHPVGFALFTAPPQQYVAFYDADRRLTIGVRDLGSPEWHFRILPTSVGWDSHNYVTLTLDDDEHLHISGNMHNVPLIYFRTTRPREIDSLEQVESMVGREEGRMTYPRFFRGPANELIFTYRDGGSGRGNQIYNVYDHETRTWRRLLDEPLIDGRGEMNAYPQGPQRGPDGFYHLVWVWRNTPDCATNHSLSYARSRDLVNWETSRGEPLDLPITIDNGEIIDPVPPGGGMINGNTRIGFDSRQRVVIAYHKFDEDGKTQLYNARLEDGDWRIYQTSDWDYRWEFSGGGSIIFEVRVEAVRVEPDGTLTQGYTHVKHGSGAWKLDEQTLRPIGPHERPPARPAELEKIESDFPGMQVRWAGDSGRSGERGARYMLRWEALPQNRDRPREGPLPDPVMLRVYRFVSSLSGDEG
jgi:hypothetical protein